MYGVSYGKKLYTEKSHIRREVIYGKELLRHRETLQTEKKLHLKRGLGWQESIHKNFTRQKVTYKK